MIAHLELAAWLWPWGYLATFVVWAAGMAYIHMKGRQP